MACPWEYRRAGRSCLPRDTAQGAGGFASTAPEAAVSGSGRTGRGRPRRMHAAGRRPSRLRRRAWRKLRDGGEPADARFGLDDPVPAPSGVRHEGREVGVVHPACPVGGVTRRGGLQGSTRRRRRAVGCLQFRSRPPADHACPVALRRWLPTRRDLLVFHRRTAASRSNGASRIAGGPQQRETPPLQQARCPQRAPRRWSRQPHGLGERRPRRGNDR